MIDLKKLRESEGYMLAIVNTQTGEYEPVSEELQVVRHGKWEMKPDPFGFFHDIPVCSECGCTTKTREKTKYCPNCGAIMDGNLLKDDTND